MTMPERLRPFSPRSRVRLLAVLAVLVAFGSMAPARAQVSRTAEAAPVRLLVAERIELPGRTYYRG